MTTDVAIQKKSRVLPKHAQIRHHLQSLIKSDDYSDGALFFTEKQVCTKFGVSMITARRVLDDLRQMGFVDRRRGVGNFVPKSNGNSNETIHKTIGMLLHNTENAFVPAMVDVMKGICERGKANGYDLKMLISSSGPVTRVVENAHLNSLIVAYQEITEQELRELKASHTALVTLGRGILLEGLHTVGSDPILALLLIGEHLAALGHRRIAFFHGPKEFEFTSRYLQGFELIVNRFDLDPKPDLLIETGRPRGGPLSELIPSDEELEVFRQMILSPQRPTAVILPTLCMAERALNIAEQSGLRVPEDLSLVSLASPAAECGDEDSRAGMITHIRLDGKMLGHRAVEVLLKLMGGESCPKNTYVKADLVVKQSTSPAHGY